MVRLVVVYGSLFPGAVFNVARRADTWVRTLLFRGWQAGSGLIVSTVAKPLRLIWFERNRVCHLDAL